MVSEEWARADLGDQTQAAIADALMKILGFKQEALPNECYTSYHRCDPGCKATDGAGKINLN